MTKEQALKRAQAAADRDGKAMAVLDFNRFSPLYVIRDYDSRMEGTREFVARVNPTGVQ